MSFNLKKYSQMDLGTKRFDPSMLAGATPEEKLAIISEYLDQNIGDAYARGEISDQDIYRMFTDKAVGNPHFPQLDQYRKNISQLRLIGLELVRKNGGNPDDQNSVREAIGTVIEKVLQRIETKFVPQLIDIYSSSTRTEEKMRSLLDVQREDLIPSIKRLLSAEIISEKNDVIRKFQEKAQELSSTFSLDEILLVVNDGKAGLQSLASKFTEQQLSLLDREVKRLNDDVNNKPNRYWNRVLSQHRGLPQEELQQWQKFQYTPVDWSLKAILREAGYTITSPIIAGTTSSYSEAYKYFFPEYQDNDQPFGSDFDRKEYALRRLSQCIQNDYDNVGKIANVMGDELILSSDSMGYLIQGYFRHSKICGRDKTKFFSDLDAIGLSDLRSQLQETVYEFDVDERYAAFNLILRSKAEKKVLSVFREIFNLDPIPFSTALASPEDCPTNENSFKIDFLLPADVLDGFEYVDGELKPIISKKVMFVGEYFGEDRDNPQALKDKKWLNPDGTPAYWINRQTGEEVEMKPGDNVPIRSVYALRSRWKIATIEALGHMIGTGGLALKRKDINTPTNIMPKLDQKNILYLYEGGTHPNGCLAVRSLIKNCIDDPAVLHYANSSAILEEMNSQKTMAMNLFDCAIVNLKMSQGLKIAKQEMFLSKNGFNRENLNNHNIMMKTKMTRRDKILLALSTSSVASNQEKASQMINELNQLNNEISTLQNSPLKQIKDKLDEILSTPEFVAKINQLESYKTKILNGEQIPALEEIRVIIRNIDEGILNEVLAESILMLRR
jgi:hypothetical protein